MPRSNLPDRSWISAAAWTTMPSLLRKKGSGCSPSIRGDKYLAMAQGHIAKEGADVTLRQMTCADLDEAERFTLAWAGSYCPGQLSPSEVVQDLRRIYRSLRPGGWENIGDALNL